MGVRGGSIKNEKANLQRCSPKRIRQKCLFFFRWGGHSASCSDCLLIFSCSLCNIPDFVLRSVQQATVLARKCGILKIVGSRLCRLNSLFRRKDSKKRDSTHSPGPNLLSALNLSRCSSGTSPDSSWVKCKYVSSVV